MGTVLQAAGLGKSAKGLSGKASGSSKKIKSSERYEKPSAKIYDDDRRHRRRDDSESRRDRHHSRSRSPLDKKGKNWRSSFQSASDKCRGLKKEVQALKDERQEFLAELAEVRRDVRDLREENRKLSDRLRACETAVSQEERDLLAPEASPGKLFDNHFHINRMGKWGLHWNELKHSNDLAGGVAVFCDPNEFPSNQLMDQLKSDPLNILIALGIHPEHAGINPYALHQALRRMAQLKSNKLVCAIGEMGFDFTKPVSLKSQEHLVAAQIPLIAPLPLILHVRGSQRDVSNDQAYDHCLFFLKGKIEPLQKIQLHSFSGNRKQVVQWTSVFPNTYFSVSGLTKHNNEAQNDGLKAIPISNLLVETDSPYLSISPSHGKRKGNSPSRLTEVISLVSNIRGETPELIRKANWENSKLFFQW